MDTNHGNIEQAGIILSMTAANDLRSRQSVRTTFKLSESTIHAVSIVAAHLGIRQKSLFDHLMDDLEALGALPASVEETASAPQGRMQKTYVISRRSLDALERISKNLHTSRDMVVEICVQRLLPIIEAERLQHQKRKGVLVDLKKQTSLTLGLLGKTQALLGKEDPVTTKIALATSAMEAALQQVADFVERGRIIEESYSAR